MRLIVVKAENQGQRLDKMLFKYLNNAPSSFVYKMLRKKNIVLNGKKASGIEILKENDEVKLFLSEETIIKFSEDRLSVLNDERYFEPAIIYEDENILCVNKPAGILSQKSTDNDYSINELLLDYLKKKGAINEETLKGFKPSVLNRLDRNTEGLILFAKTYCCANEISKHLRNRTIHKYYYCIVLGIVKKEMVLDGYLYKDKNSNIVKISNKKKSAEDMPIKTHLYPKAVGNNVTLLEVELITGKTHQIRAHLSSVGHPIIGDMKYGDTKANHIYREKYGIAHQMLFSHKVIFPKLEGNLSKLSEKIIELDVPPAYEDVIYGNMEKPRT